MKFIFSVVLWDDTGNVLIEKRTATIRRVKLSTAREVMIRKFPRPYFFELESSINN